MNVYQVISLGWLLNVATAVPFYYLVYRRGNRSEEERFEEWFGHVVLCLVPWLYVLKTVLLLTVAVLTFRPGRKIDDEDDEDET